MRRNTAHIHNLLNRAVLFIVILFSITNGASAQQSLPEIEKSILTYCKRIHSLKLNLIPENAKTIEDSSRYLSNQLLEYLKEVCIQYPELLTYDFKGISTENGFSYPVSSDKKFRIYSLMNDFSLVQYKTNSGVKIEVLNDGPVDTNKHDSASVWHYTHIHDYSLKNGAVIYLASGESSRQPPMIESMLSTFSIEGDTLTKEIPFFNKKEKLLTHLQVLYRFSDVPTDTVIGNGHFGIKRHFPDFIFSPDKKKLFVPFVFKHATATNGKPIYKFFVYKFNGDQLILNKRNIDIIVF